MKRTSAVAVELPKPGRDREVLLRDLGTFGYCVIADALHGELLKEVQNRLIEQARLERRLHNAKNPANMDADNQWVGMLLNKGTVFMELIRHELCMSLLEHVLGSEYLISCVDAQIQHPGAHAMPLHTDQWWMPDPATRDGAQSKPADAARHTGTATDPESSAITIAPVAEANVMWMVSDFTEQNGATRIVPRSHLSGKQPDPSVPHNTPTVAAVGPAGTAIAFDGRIWHGAAANNSSTSRYGITTAGCGPQFRQIENYTRGLRPEVFEHCDAEILKRLGFTPWSGYGHTGDPDAVVSATGERAMGKLHE